MRSEILLLAFVLAACGTAKRGITDGAYRMERTPTEVQVIEDTIRVMRMGPVTGIDTRLVLPPSAASQLIPRPVRLVQRSFDVDALTAPFKYRPSSDGLQPRWETQFSAALYVGYRTDLHTYRYPRSRFSRWERQEKHWGISLGMIGGLGGATVDPFTTQGKVSDTYTGVV